MIQKCRYPVGRTQQPMTVVYKKSKHAPAVARTPTPSVPPVSSEKAEKPAAVDAKREAEAGKYRVIYDREPYLAGGPRVKETRHDLAALPCRGSILDVGCGRGEFMKIMRELGFSKVVGVDVIRSFQNDQDVFFGYAHSLPFTDKSFDVAVLFDVIEHLVPGDDELACRELARVARKHVLVSASNRVSVHQGWDMHINKRTYEEWHRLFNEWFAPAKASQLGGAEDRRSPMWRVDLC